LSQYHLNPSKACLDKLDEIDLSRFCDLVHHDPSFYRFMKYVVKIRSGTPEMLAYWLMKNMVAEVRVEVYGVSSFMSFLRGRDENANHAK
jgi:hypothetical protein